MPGVPDTVTRKLDALPDQPGVYLWKGRGGEVLYVGKAKRLRQRVRSYVTADYSDSPKHRMLVRQIADLETIVVPSEAQALLLENNLIKEHAPRYNIQLRDDKSYPYIAVTLGEAFPRVLVVRRVRVHGARYFGPYTDVGKLRRTLRIIRRIFTVRSCHYDLPIDAPDRPCLDYHIHRCLAPCVAYQSREDYRGMIADVLAFLEGRTVEVRTRLRERMDAAAARLDFERAAELRNSLRWLEQLEDAPAVEQVGGGEADVVGYARDGDDAVGVVLRVRTGKVVAREQRFLHNLAEEADATVLAAFLVRSYLPLEARVSRTVLPFAPQDLEDLATLAPGTDWLLPHRGRYRRLADLADQNARHLLESFRIESFEADERVEDPVYALGRDLGITTVPRSFVCVDISTWQGRDTVGSLVWFEAGRPKKSEYRRFRIRGNGSEGVENGEKGEGKVDDYAAIREVVTRYLTRRVADAEPLPDLMLIDGGKGQLHAAREALEQVGVSGIQLASIAKREEEVFLPDRPESIRLPRTAPSLRLLQRARDEAHRFAVTYNRRRRAVRTVTSALLDVPGIGPSRRRALLERFGSLAGVRLASRDEIASVKGISTAMADRILSHLKP